jgi:hypothetical protein
MKLNLGSGSKSIEGFVNVDKYPSAATDLVFDLETLPWPWPSDSAEEVHFIHSLEHMGGDPETFLNIMKELYRVCKDGAVIVIHVPHPRHDAYLGDPTHVRPITPGLLSLFDRQLNDEWVAGGTSAATPLAHYIDVDFRVSDVATVLDPAYHEQYRSGELTGAALERLAKDLNNVIVEFQIRMIARKP